MFVHCHRATKKGVIKGDTIVVAGSGSVISFRGESPTTESQLPLALNKKERSILSVVLASYYFRINSDLRF